MALRFGTDGVRGRVPDDLSVADVRRLGAAAAEVLGGSRFLVGRDTRESGPALEQALLEGLASRGVVGERLGVVPTPTVAWLAAADSLPGAMISASHNPYSDNGVKLFAPGGSKLSDAMQDRVQQVLDVGETIDAGPVTASDGDVDVERYEAAVVASLEGRDLSGLHVVIDCANGAASAVAPATLAALGAKVDVLFAEPDGRNINEGCGSTHPQALQAEVRSRGADVGLAFDGDADRVLAVDDAGALIDGDQIIAICAIDRKARGRLAGDAVVVTVMTNLGFRLAMRHHDITVVETAVGDRNVLEALEARSLSLGGEQSGHVIFRELATTGDGLLTGVQLLDVVKRTGRPLAALANAAMERLPQVLRNVHVQHRVADLASLLSPAITAVEAALGDRGRVLVRPSGTEPLVRVMVEAGTRAAAEEAAAKLADEVGRVTRSGEGA
jgi:phosphoglucosamine mutase